MKDAMTTVRAELGEDAVIVSSRNDPRGGGVHVTAALDDAPLADPAGRSAEDWLQYDAEREETSVAEDLTDLMLFHAVPEAVVDEIISCATVSGHADPRAALAEAFTHLFFFDRLPAGAHARPLVVVGPPGAGKTSVVARLAARGAMAGLRVAAITADGERAGAAAQLGALTKLMEVPLRAVQGPEALTQAVEAARAAGAQQVLVDTAAANPFAAQDMRDLAALIKAAGGDTILTMPAGMDTEEAAEAARIFAAAGARRFLPTRLDGARRLGALLAAAHKAGVTFVGSTACPSVAQGVDALTPDALAAAFLRRAPAAADARGASLAQMVRKREGAVA
jgi:flagellar biosynthesis protein FlhF